MPAAPAVSTSAAERFQALSDETRLKILGILAGGERCVCELVSQLEISQPLLSHHLKTLRSAGLVFGRRQGRWMYYRLEADCLSDCCDTLTDVLGQYQESARKGRPGCSC
jgi:ArsR family transcriptional regulator